MTAEIPIEEIPDPTNRSILFNTYQRARFLLSLAAIIAFILFLVSRFDFPYSLRTEL